MPLFRKKKQPTEDLEDLSAMGGTVEESRHSSAMPQAWRPTLPAANKDAKPMRLGAAPASATPAAAGAPPRPAPVRLGDAKPPTPAAKEAEATPAAAPMTLKPAATHSHTRPLVTAGSQKMLYKQLMNGLYDAILITDEKGHIVENNNRAPDYFGFDGEELWNMQIANLVAGITSVVFDRVRSAIGGDRYVLMNSRCTRKDGSTFLSEVGISTISMLGKDDFVFAIRNIERRATQLRNLRSSQSAFMNAQCAGFVCDMAKRVVTVNNAFMELLRLSSSSPVAGVLLTQFVPNAAEYLDRALSGETLKVECSVNIDGVPTACSLALAPNRLGGASIEGFVGSLMLLNRKGV